MVKSRARNRIELLRIEFFAVTMVAPGSANKGGGLAAWTIHIVDKSVFVDIKLAGISILSFPQSTSISQRLAL